ncbi:hypothetical protein MMU07_21335 [Aquiflexum sp. LQ15W]|uniref:hypothetical protein n=1 Tax=Cognataquiflexum nitidum TaxID=2922272 RepID=UPI001F14949D|nr:hypothetical protein [Cognataquiflexum nitidum]MCH6202135.1 hypothetical protein [Cognataquiflexum nitidum]
MFSLFLLWFIFPQIAQKDAELSRSSVILLLGYPASPEAGYTISIPQWTVNFRKRRKGCDPLFSLFLLWFIFPQIAQKAAELSRPSVILLLSYPASSEAGYTIFLTQWTVRFRKRRKGCDPLFSLFLLWFIFPQIAQKAAELSMPSVILLLSYPASPEVGYTIFLPQWTVRFRKRRKGCDPLFSLFLLWFIFPQIAQKAAELSRPSVILVLSYPAFSEAGYTISIPQTTVSFRHGRKECNPLFSLFRLLFNCFPQTSQKAAELSRPSVILLLSYPASPEVGYTIFIPQGR